MTLPKQIDTQVLTRDGQPAPGMFIKVRLRMPRKNDYHLVFGPSDAQGRITVTHDRLLAEARREAEFFLMDYGDAAEAADEVSVTPLSSDDLDRAISAHDLYAQVAAYPASWRTDLERARRVVTAWAPLRARVEFK
jgi:hypothetical protein